MGRTGKDCLQDQDRERKEHLVMDTAATVERIQTPRKWKPKPCKRKRHGMLTLSVYRTHITAVILLVICGSVFAENFTAGVPPIIASGPPPHRPYNDQQAIKLECNAEGTPAPTYKWFKNGKDLGTNASNYRIMKANKTHQGYYQCQASNPLGTAMSNHTFLERIFLARGGSGSNASNLKELAGRHFVAECDKMKGTEVSYEWRKITVTDGYTCGRSARRGGNRVFETKRISIYEDNGSLAFSDLKVSDAGVYKCFALGGGGNIGAGCFNLSITDPFDGLSLVPTFMHHSRSPLQVFEGDDFHLQCFFSGTPTPSVTWTKTDGNLPRDRTKVEEVGHRITIQKAKVGDSGYYKCFGKNSAGKSDDIKIQVQVYARPRFTDIPMSQNTSLNKDVHFKCNGTGHPTPNITWYKNTKEIEDNSSRIIISSDGRILTLLRVNKDDTATYHCNISNVYGSQLTAAYLSASDDYLNVYYERKGTGEQEGDKGGQKGGTKLEWLLIPICIILVAAIIATVFIVMRKRRNSLSYQLRSVDPPDPRISVGGEHAVGDRLLGQESGGSAVSV